VDLHEYLAAAVQPEPGQRIVDLGCGAGRTLAELARREPAAKLTGVDRDTEDLRLAASSVGAASEPLALVDTDLRRPLPFDDGWFDAAVCSDVLESLPKPRSFLSECERILRPGGCLVLAHPDYETLVYASSFRELTRRMVQAYAQTQQPWQDAVDGQLGRELLGIVRTTSLEVVGFECFVRLSTRFAVGELGYERALEMLEIVSGADDWLTEEQLRSHLADPTTRCAAGFDADELLAWLDDQGERAVRGAHVFTVNVYVVTCRRAGA
jgi:SAM-dependent methyltransferase